MAEKSRIWYNRNMGIINEPSIGQAIDVNYISEIVREVNLLNGSLGTKLTQSRIPKGDNTNKPTQAFLTSNLSIVTGRTMVTTDNSSKTADVKPFNFEFGRTFRYVPIVTATPQVEKTGIKGKTLGVSVIIQNVTTSQVSGVLVFNSEAKNTSVYINIIAVGAPAGAN
jgi:hypothetical protein